MKTTDKKRPPLSPLTPSESNKRRKGDNNTGEKTLGTGISLRNALANKFPRLPDEILEITRFAYFQPMVDALLTITDADFSEEDPLLLVLPTLTNPDSIAYCNMGNYGLPEGTPGHRAWPGECSITIVVCLSLFLFFYDLFLLISVVRNILAYLQKIILGGAPPVPGQAVAAGIDAMPPNALGVFLSQQGGFTDKSHGHGLVFSVSSFGDLDRAVAAMQGSAQFVRYGPVFAGVLGVPPQPPLVQFVLLTTLTGVPQILTRFNAVS